MNTLTEFARWACTRPVLRYVFMLTVAVAIVVPGFFGWVLLEVLE